MEEEVIEVWGGGVVGIHGGWRWLTAVEWWLIGFELLKGLAEVFENQNIREESEETVKYLILRIAFFEKEMLILVLIW